MDVVDHDVLEVVQNAFFVQDVFVAQNAFVAQTAFVVQDVFVLDAPVELDAIVVDHAALVVRGDHVEGSIVEEVLDLDDILVELDLDNPEMDGILEVGTKKSLIYICKLTALHLWTCILITEL